MLIIILTLNQIKSNQMSLPNVRFAVKTTSVTPPSITGRYQCTTQADRDVGYREWFKTVPAIYHEINMNMNGVAWNPVGTSLVSTGYEISHTYPSKGHTG